MIESIVLVLFFIMYNFISILMFLDCIYVIQLDGYSIRKIFSNYYVKIKDNYLNYFLVLIIIIFMWFLDFKNIYFLMIYLVVEFALFFVFIFHKKLLKKTKFTKRVFRLFFAYILLNLFVSLIVSEIQIFYLIILFPIVDFLYVLFMSLSILITKPIEKFIGLYYIKKAKKKLLNFNNLIKIGITGSFGKTSTKEILFSILSQEYSALATPKSFNTPFGLSLTINDYLKPTNEILICEMGAKKLGEIRELCLISNIEYGIVTSVGRQHTSTFGSIENIYRTKKELPDFLHNKFCVFNLMNAYTAIMFKEFVGQKIGVFVLFKRNKKFIKKVFKNKLYNLIGFKKTIFYEFVKSNNVYAKKIKLNSDGSTFDIYYNNDFICTAKLKLIGVHNVINTLLAVAMAKRLGLKDKAIEIGIEKIKSINARFETSLNKNGAIIINNGYNSNLDSAVYSLKAMQLFNKSHKVIITPGLIECTDNYDYNFQFGKLIAKYCSDIIIVKKTNRDAILSGIKDAKFDLAKVYVVDDFKQVQKVISEADETYSVLIENDLPDNYK